MTLLENLRPPRPARHWRLPAAGLGALGLLAAVCSVLGSGPGVAPPSGTPIASGALYFTVFSPPAVERVAFSYLHHQLQLGTPALVAGLGGADGVVFAPDGRLIVGGARTGTIESLNTANGLVVTSPAGGGAYHLSLAPDGRFLYTSGEPGALVKVPLDPLGPGTIIPVHGSDPSVTSLAFLPDGRVAYTRSAPGGRGDIGFIDLATGTTTRLLTGVPAAHGILYDPYSKSLLVMGGDTVFQLPVSDPSHVISALTVPGTVLDQGAVDGRGQALFSSNKGQLVLVDYAASDRVGTLSNNVIVRYLAHNLDDVAPLVGPGAPPIATLARWWRLGGFAALALLVGAAVALAIPSIRRRRQKPAVPALPRWDRRVRTQRIQRW